MSSLPLFLVAIIHRINLMKTNKNTLLALKLTALAGAAGITPGAQAAIVHSTTTPFSTPWSGNSIWDVDGIHAVFDISQRRIHTVSGFSDQVRASLNPFSGGHFVASADFSIARLALGEIVGATLGTSPKPFTGRWFATGMQIVTTRYGNNGQPLQLGSNYIGFSFQNGSTTDYGWANLVLNATYDTAFTIQDAYYDNTGAAITVGAMDAVPEPSSIALLALGATGLAAWRRRQKAAGTKTA